MLLTTLAERILPQRVYASLIGAWDREGLQRYLRNTGWLLVGRVVLFVTSFITLIYVVRYLGPENLGKLSYAQSVIAIVSMFASLGIDQIVYRDLVAHPEREREILGTAIAAKFAFGLITFLVVTGFAFLVHDESMLTWLVAIIALSFLCNPLNVVANVFSARVQARYLTFLNVAAAIVIPILKFAVIFTNKGILYFAAIIVVEAILVSALSVFLYVRFFSGSLRALYASWPRFIQLVHDSWPIMLIGATGYLYTRIDQVMIQHYLDSASVGLYEAAVRFTDPLGLFPSILVSSLFPALINARTHSLVEYRKRLRALIGVCLGVAIGLAGTVYVIAPYLIGILYGPEFTASTPVLRIYVWSTVGTIAISLMYTHFVAENKVYLQLIYTSVGALINIILNITMIPAFGIVGAAYATLLTVTAIVAAFVIHTAMRARPADHPTA